MTEIRYWQGLENGPGVSRNEQVKKAREAVEKYDQSFQSELLGQLSQLDGDALAGSSSGLSSDMFGRGGPELMNLDIDGIEKVWAAQMDSPLGYFNNQGFGNNNSSDTSGLAGMVDLMVKEQIAKARQQIEQQQPAYSFDEFLNEVSGEEAIDVPDESPPQALDNFITSIDEQIKSAAQTYELPEAEIRRRIAGF